jgi:glycerate 2-kinase
MQVDRFRTHSLDDPRIGRILSAALHAVRPDLLVSKYLEEHSLPPHRRLFILGIGKAAESMVRAAEKRSAYSAALAVTKHAADRPRQAAEPASPGRVEGGAQPPLKILEAGHPLPDARSVAAGEAVARFVSEIRQDDLLLCLISGGGSALVAAPPSGVSLQDLRQVSDALLRSGASIEEVNIVRRRLDRLKGGGLVAATKSPIISLLLSDVMGDRLDTIASGLTMIETTAPDQALAILQKYGISTSNSVLEALRRPPHILPAEASQRVMNRVVGNNLTARTAAHQQAKLEGFHAVMSRAWLQGEASAAGKQLASRLAGAVDEMPRPFCIVEGGETTVSVRGGGQGGRNQEMALAAVDRLDGLEDVFLITMATDGDDGPTDAAGAVVTGETCRRGSRGGMNAETFLARNDSYHYFDALGDLLRIGYTGTNVNDLTLLMGV